MDITGCAHLFGGEAKMARQVARDLVRRGFKVQTAVADTIGVAWGLARYGFPAETRPAFEGGGPLVVPAGKSADVLGPLPIGALRAPLEVVEVLEELGLRTIGQLMALPRETLPARFGPQVLRRLDQALGNLAEPLVLRKSEEPVEASWGCEPPIEGFPAVEAVLRRLLARIVRLLERRNEGILQLGVELTCVALRGTGREIRFFVGLVRPTLNRRRLLELARLQFDRLQLERSLLHGGVGAVTVRVTRTAPLDMEQTALFELPERPCKQGDLDSLLNRLNNRLGDTAVLRPRLCPDYQPERAVEYRTGMENPAEGPTGPCPPRPLRLFPRPLPVAVWSTVPDGPPVRLQWDQRDQRIVHCEGPERIETGWWRRAVVHRDYFRADTETGQRLWLFRSHDSGGWFVQGEF